MTALHQEGYIRLPEDRTTISQGVRDYLIQTPGLHPLTVAGVRCRTAYLEHRLHASAIISKLMELLGCKELPGKGFKLVAEVLHAVLHSAAPRPPPCLVWTTPGPTAMALLQAVLEMRTR